MANQIPLSAITFNQRILVVDDDQLVLDNFDKTLNPAPADHSTLAAFFLQPDRDSAARNRFDLVTACQGEEGVKLVAQSLQEGTPFAAAFIDVHMPPGMAGLEAVRQIRQLDDHIHIIAFTAFSDHPAEDIQAAAKHHIILARKPLAGLEIVQLARNACITWQREWEDREEQSVINQLGKHFLASQQMAIEDIARYVLKTSCSLTASQYGLVGEIDSLKDDLLLRALTPGLLPDNAPIRMAKKADCPFWWVMDHQAPLLVNFPLEYIPPWQMAELAIPLSRFLAVPIRRGTTTVGIIAVINRVEEYTTAHLRRMERVADLFAIVLDRVNLERQVRHIQKLEAIGTLSGGIAHDFNNILGVILGYTEISLYKTPPTDAIHNYLQEISKGVTRGKTLVNQLLAFSRGGESQRIPLPLTPLIKEVAAFIRTSTPSSIIFNVSIKQDGLTILADASQIYQLVLNLCINAKQAIPQEQGTIHLTLERTKITEEMTPRLHAPVGNYALIQVKDSGTGIPEELQERIFDPFFTTKAVGEGEGLGLSVVHGIVIAQGGTIAMENQPEGGTIFRVYLPLLESREAITHPIALPPIMAGKGKILMVDDESQLLFVYEKILATFGYHVVSCQTAQEALQRFNHEPDTFVALVADQAMPNMSGLDLAKQIKNQKPTLPVILCTGLATHLSTTETGVDLILQKPVSGRELASSLSKLLEPHHD